jgi:transcriptional regulator with XRE-family HTH domain
MAHPIFDPQIYSAANPQLVRHLLLAQTLLLSPDSYLIHALSPSNFVLIIHNSFRFSAISSIIYTFATLILPQFVQRDILLTKEVCIISTNEKIQALRKQHQLTQRELADRLHTSRSTVANWETGRSLPNLEALDKISRFFEKAPGYFLDKDEHKKDLLHWTAPDDSLISMHILAGDHLLFKSFTFPRDGEIMLLQDKENPDHTFAALVERYEDNYFYRLTMEKRIPLQGRAEPLGYYIELIRKKRNR